MTITTNDDRDEYTATASQTVFNYTFKIFASTDLNVYQTPAGQTADDSTDLITAYTVSGVGNAAGGTITLTTPASAGDLITIVSNVPSSRTTDYQISGDFIPATVNNDFDRMVSLAKQAEGLARRSLLFPESQQGVQAKVLPKPDNGKIFAWSESGEVVYRSITDLATTIDINSTVDVYPHMADFITRTPTKDMIYVESYATWSPGVTTPKGAHFRYRTGGTNTSPTVGSPVAVSTIGTGTQAGYAWDASGAEWFILPGDPGYNICALGAVDDGTTTDDTTAIQSAISIAQATGGAVYVPAGNYSASSLTVTAASNDGYGLLTTRLKIHGDGHASRIIGRGASDLLTIGNGSGGTTLFDVIIDGIRLDGGGVTTNNLVFDAMHRVVVNNCRIDRSNGNGIAFLDRSFGSHVITNSLIRNNAGKGIYIPPAADGGGAQDNGNATKIESNTILMNGSTGVHVGAGVGVTISRNDISSNGDGGIYAKSVFGLTIEGNYFEDHTDGTYKSSIWIDTSVFAVGIRGNYMFLRDDGGELYGVYSEACTSFKAEQNFIQSFSGSGGTGFYFADGTFASVGLDNNAFTGLATRVRKPATDGITRYRASHQGDGGGICGPVFGGIDLVSSDPGLHIVNEDSTTGQDDWTIRSTNDINDRSYLSLVADGTEQLRFERDSQMATNDVAMWIRCNRSGTITLSPVSIGSTDSGDPGFRCLMVPN